VIEKSGADPAQPQNMGYCLRRDALASMKFRLVAVALMLLCVQSTLLAQNLPLMGVPRLGKRPCAKWWLCISAFLAAVGKSSGRTFDTSAKRSMLRPRSAIISSTLRRLKVELCR
jgi:hypothetical protein